MNDDFNDQVIQALDKLDTLQVPEDKKYNIFDMILLALMGNREPRLGSLLQDKKRTLADDHPTSDE